MASVLEDNITVGRAPLPMSGRTFPSIASGIYEFKPTVSPTSTDLEEYGNGDNYISTYQPFSLSVTAIPNLPEEIITSTRVTLKYCILEEPLPGADTTRSLNAPLKIPVSPYWAPGLFFEPLIFTTPGVSQSPAIISGYFTERNFYDREWIVEYKSYVARFTSNGLFYAPLKNFPVNLPFDLKKISLSLNSSVNINNFYPLTISAANRYDAEILQPYLSRVKQVISYKPSEIKKLRFFFDIEITSNKGIFNFTAHMTVQQNQKAANRRLEFALNRRRENAEMPTFALDL